VGCRTSLRAGARRLIVRATKMGLDKRVRIHFKHDVWGAIAATSPSRWPRSPFQELSSPNRSRRRRVIRVGRSIGIRSPQTTDELRREDRKRNTLERSARSCPPIIRSDCGALFLSCQSSQTVGHWGGKSDYLANAGLLTSREVRRQWACTSTDGLIL